MIPVPVAVGRNIRNVVESRVNVLDFLIIEEYKQKLEDLNKSIEELRVSL